MWVQFLGREDPLEEGMATQSNILAWRIPMDGGAWGATVHRIASCDIWELSRKDWMARVDALESIKGSFTHISRASAEIR